MLLLNIILILLVNIVAVVGVFGETYVSSRTPFYKRLTKKGWVAVGALALATLLGAIKEFVTDRENDALAKHNSRLLQRLEGQRTQIDDLEKQLVDSLSKQTTALVSEFKAKHSPKIFEGHWQTEGDVTYRGTNLILDLSAGEGNSVLGTVNGSYRFNLNGKMVGESTAEVSLAYLSKGDVVTSVGSGYMKIIGEDDSITLQWTMTELSEWGKKNVPKEAGLWLNRRNE